MKDEACASCGALPHPIGERACAAVLGALRPGPRGGIRWRRAKGGLRFTFQRAEPVDEVEISRLERRLHDEDLQLAGAFTHDASAVVKRIALQVERRRVA